MEDLEVTNVFDARGSDQLQEYDQDLRNFGTYIQGDYTIRPGCVRIGCDFKLDIGVRYNVEYKKFDILTCGFKNRTCNAQRVTITGKEDEMWDGWSGDFIFSWIYNEEESNVYIKYSRGWKGGHFNGGATTKFDVITGVDPEIVDSYELGLRSHWFDGRLMTNVTGFFYDYKDLQVFKLEQDPLAGFTVAKLVNAQDADVYGVELDIAAQPIEGMNITFNAAWVESEYNEFVTDLPFRFQPQKPGGRPIGEITIVRFPFDYSGNDLIGSPRFSFTGSIDYEIPLPGQICGARARLTVSSLLVQLEGRHLLRRGLRVRELISTSPRRPSDRNPSGSTTRASAGARRTTDRGHRLGAQLPRRVLQNVFR